MAGGAPLRGSSRPLVAGLACALLALGCGGGSDDEARPAQGAAAERSAPVPRAELGRNPHIVLVVIDTLRADHVGCYGYERPTTPTLDALAAEGVLFENAFSVSSWTRPAVASLFTSSFPSRHGVVDFGRRLPPRSRTLAERLAEHGYFTAGVSANFVHVSGTAGLNQGFQRWKILPVETDPGAGGEAFWKAEDDRGDPRRFRPAQADEVNASLFELLPATFERPAFLYVHYMEPHSDYAPPEAFRERFVRNPTERFATGRVTSDDLVALAAGRAQLTAAERQHLIDLYDAEIAAADAGLAALLEGLEARGLEDPLVVVTSDHGEAFGEHESWFHGITLHRESLAVPLVIRDPSHAPAGERRPEPVSLLDVAPTLLERAGLATPRGMHGEALLAPRPPPAERTLVAELHPDPRFEEHAMPRSQRLAAQRGSWKLLLDGEGDVRAYRVADDPDELEPVPLGPDGPPTPFVNATKRGFVLLARMLAEREEAAPLSEQEVRRLEALGYVGAEEEPGS